jgi:hypothetical protein
MTLKREIIEAEYCPRTKHSSDMPLKKARRNCALSHFNRGNQTCMWTPMLLKYCKKNKIKWTYATQIRCVLDKGKETTGGD